MSNEGDAIMSVKKKHKNRKSIEVSRDLGVKEDSALLAGESHPNKKKRTEVLGDVTEVVPDVGFGADMDKTSKKKKKKKDKRGVDVDTLGDDNKSKGKMKRGATGDKGGAYKDLEASHETVNEASNLGRSKKQTNRVGKNDKEYMDGGDKSIVLKFDTGVGRVIELVNGEEVDSRLEGHAKKKNITDKGINKAIDVGDKGFVQSQTNCEVTGNKKQKNMEYTGDRYLGKELMGISHANSGEDFQVEGGSSSEQVKNKKKIKSEKCNDANASEIINMKGSISHSNLIENQIPNVVIENIQPVKDKKRKKKKKDDLGAGSLDKEFGKNYHAVSISDSKKSQEMSNKKRKEKSKRGNIEDDANIGTCEDSDRNDTAEPSKNSSRNKKSKKVQFSENIEVFPLPDTSSEGKEKMVERESEEQKNVDDGMVQGKRFSKEEDDIIQNAVYKYVEDHQLGEEGVEMVMECSKHRELKGCWKEIAKCLAHRPHLSVYYRAHMLFERSKDRKWTPEEIEVLKELQKKHGSDWKPLSVELGKHRLHVKDAWRRIKLPNRKTGSWSQDEYKNLFELVNMDLSMKAFTEKRTKHGMLRDNISWEAISDQLTTRCNATCCTKWYRSLTSPMVAEGKWANTDDYRMLIALVDLDAPCEEDVDWDNLLENRSGDICRKRWNQMVRNIGEHGTKPFIEQVEILSQRYCPNLLEARETYDNKTPVD